MGWRARTNRRHLNHSSNVCLRADVRTYCCLCLGAASSRKCLKHLAADCLGGWDRCGAWVAQGKTSTMAVSQQAERVAQQCAANVYRLPASGARAGSREVMKLTSCPNFLSRNQRFFFPNLQNPQTPQEPHLAPARRAHAVGLKQTPAKRRVGRVGQPDPTACQQRGRDNV